jgi:hypothetical protein
MNKNSSDPEWSHVSPGTGSKRGPESGRYPGRLAICVYDEGSFVTEKQHYGLDKVKARIEKNEILWIFFGVHMANAVRIAKRLAQEKLPHIAA